MRRVDGEVLRLRCTSCGGDSATFLFSGDTDMVTAGLASVTAPASGEVYIGELRPDELAGGEPERLGRFAARVSKERGVDFRPVPLLRAEQQSEGPVTVEFQTFLRSYKRPELVFGCPRCGGEARVTEQETAAHYVARGGPISAPGLSLDREDR